MADFPVLIAVAFVFGFGARLVRLPPLVGFLVAGFALNAMGFGPTAALDTIAGLGITLLLFSIGLKLRVRDLLRPAIWGGTTIYMALTVLLFGALFLVLGFGLFGDLDLPTAALVAFALSFSSTVFAVKIFDEQGQSASFQARTAIGILIVQDLIAVIFVAATSGKVPSPWALGLVLLIPARRGLNRLIDLCGHGELLLLLGVVMTFGGSALFESVGLKGELGALVFGMLAAGHPKAGEMARSLLGFKDLFLVGFFLSIGLLGVPVVGELGVALFLVLLVPVKILLYFGVLTRFNLRARTATMASINLGNFSEFGLIVGAIGVKAGLLSEAWLLILAVTVAISFIGASPVSGYAYRVYDRFRESLMRFQTDRRVPEEACFHPGDAELIIFGMGSVGTGAYDSLREDFGGRVLGVDADAVTVKSHVDDGRNVILGDPTDSDFWDRVVREGNRIRVVMLALPNHRANLTAAAEINAFRDVEDIVLTATVKFDDQARDLEAHGVDAAYNLYAEAGQGYAEVVRKAMGTFS